VAEDILSEFRLPHEVEEDEQDEQAAAVEQAAVAKAMVDAAAAASAVRVRSPLTPRQLDPR
jgi:hypothetical protein